MYFFCLLFAICFMGIFLNLGYDRLHKIDVWNNPNKKKKWY